MAEDFSAEAWDRLTDALVEVFGADRLDVDAEAVRYRKDDATFLVVRRDRTLAAAMPLHSVELAGVEGVEPAPEAGTVTFHTAGDRYTYHCPF